MSGGIRTLFGFIPKVEIERADYEDETGLGPVVDGLFRNRVFQAITLGHLHVLIHELGHATAGRCCGAGRGTIVLSKRSLFGSTTYEFPRRADGGAKETWILLSGPLANVIFSITMIVGTCALTHYVSMPKGVKIGLLAWAVSTNAIWIFGEFLHAAVSSAEKSDGDFGKIAQIGPTATACSFLLLISMVALTIIPLNHFYHFIPNWKI